MNKALFEVGEVVMILKMAGGILSPVKLTERMWDEDQLYSISLGRYTGWCYACAESVGTWAQEWQLRKLPSLADYTFDELTKQLNEEQHTEFQYEHEKERSYE